MDALVARWLASDRNPQLLFPGTLDEIIVFLTAWVAQRKRSTAQLTAARDQVQARTEAFLISGPVPQGTPRAQKKKMAKETLELMQNLNPQALTSAASRETRRADYLLNTLASCGFRQPDDNPAIRVEEKVCAYLAQMYPGIDERKELALLVDTEAEERQQAKRLEIAEAVREMTGLDVFVNAEAGAADVGDVCEGWIGVVEWGL